VHHELISDEINKEWFAARSATQRSDQAALAEPILPPATQREVASKSLRTIVGTITFDLWPRAVSEEPEEENRVESIIPELAGIIIY
jgi:hypothetical protein